MGAAATPYAHDVIRAAEQRHRRVAIVSNNSAHAIGAYLDNHELSEYISYVAGRKPYCPEKMKPHPYTILESLSALNAEAYESVFIGDSLTDIAASHKAGVRIIGFANRPGKIEAFAAAGADAIVTSLADVADVLNRTGTPI